MDASDEQQFCLRWNNFQANITSQFETLRDDEDFTDVTIACEGQRLQAHKVVLSACSPYFKELFKNNPCSHPIIFMRDVEARHIVALMEFMYAGEVNVAQTHLSAFLKTAESLKIRGLTDTHQDFTQKEDENFLANSLSTKECSKNLPNGKLRKNQNIVACNSTVTSSQDIALEEQIISSPPPKRQCITETENEQLQKKIVIPDLSNLNEHDELILNTSNINTSDDCEINAKPKIELPDYISDEEKEDKNSNYFTPSNDVSVLTGVDVITQNNFSSTKQSKLEMNIGQIIQNKHREADCWSSLNIRTQSLSPDITHHLEAMKENSKHGDGSNRLIKLAEGIEIYEEQLRSVKWSDYRKLTRGLATILFSPAELATCSVTGQRWSRAGNGERPVKPALDKTKVQAIISYVATRFPTVEISRIKQVLAYKCKENSTAFKMKAVRCYGDQIRDIEKY